MQETRSLPRLGRRSLAPLWLASLLVVAAAAVISPAQDSGAAAPWVELFDGKTLDGWTQWNGTADYRVEGDMIVGTTAKGSPNSFLATKRFFGDFELEFETKLFDDGLNSGVQIRSHSYPSYRDGRVHGYQVEIATNGNAGFIYDEARRGWLSKEREGEEKRAAFERGAWNRYRVVCQGSSIRTWINDIAIADVTDSMVANGFIALQVHSVDGDQKWRVAWRKIRIREIGDGGGWTSLFDGRSLAGWKVNENPDSVRVVDGAMVVKGPRAHVFYGGPGYSHSFKNFDFIAQVKTRPQANSGIYF
nr:DUF1080 domain-containing protein [Planctomycetota bacterium]